MLLLEEKLTDRLPCPTTEQVARALAEGAPGMAPGLHVLMDLIEVAEALGAHAVHLLLDRRKHGTHSLLSPSLSAFQGEALCVYMPGVLLDKERLCRLQLPYDARTGTSKGGAAVAGAVPGTAPASSAAPSDAPSDAHDSAHRGTPLVEHLLDLDPELLPVQCLHLELLQQSELERLGRIGGQRRTGRRRRAADVQRLHVRRQREQRRHRHVGAGAGI
jgi:hypothetical protein